MTTRDERIRGKIIIVSMKIRGITTCLLLPLSRGVAVAAVVHLINKWGILGDGVVVGSSGQFIAATWGPGCELRRWLTRIGGDAFGSSGNGMEKHGKPYLKGGDHRDGSGI